jgi:hypothetical protein
VLLEGPAIEPLLAQVRDEYGSSVRIISADKVRSGGFGGFFAKQHYELSVEVPDAEEREVAQRPPVAEEPPQTLEQLLARAESRDRIAPGPDPIDRLSGRDAGIGDADAAVGRPAPEAGSPPGAGRAAADPGAAFAELMAGLDKADSSPWGRPGPRPAAAEPDRPESPTVRPFRPAQATGSPVNGATRAQPAVPSLAELMGGLGVNDAPTFPTNAAANLAAQNPAPPRTAAAAYGLVPASPAPAGSELAETLAGLGLGVPATAATPTVHATTSAQPPALLRQVQADPVQLNLMRVGLPEAMAAQIIGGDTYAGVLSVLAARPSAPPVPDAPGEILVVCGDLDHALPIARTLCEQSGIDQAHLMLGGPTGAGTGMHASRVLGDPPLAATKADRLQNADHAWIVVIDAPVGRTDPLWVSDMCDAVGATAVWAVVDATRKTADSARHLRSLGEVEALVVHSVDITADPATVLGLDLPIVSLDGKPATPHSWAAMLCARIASDVVPMAALPRRPARIR